MKINFQSLLYPSSSHNNLQRSDSISIIHHHEPQPTLNLSKQLSITKSKTNIQATMKDLLETSVSNIPLRKNQLNTSIQESFRSQGSLDYNTSFIKSNYTQKYDNFKWKNIKGDVMKTMQEQSKKQKKIVPRKDLHQTLYNQKVKTIKSKVTREFVENKQREKQAEYLYSYKLKNNKKKLTRPNICEELYSQHRTTKIHNEIRNRFITHDMTKQCSFHPSIYNKPKHLKNYKPLMDRLEQELAKRQQEEIFKSYHKNIDFGDTNQEMFKPKLRKTGISVKSKVYDFMKEREKSLESIRSLETQSLEKKKSSKISRVLNRSVEIIQSREQQYVQKLMNKLFMNNNKVHISADTISRLEEEEFEIIYPFVLNIEKESVDFDKDQFHDRFMSFFKKLTVDEKHTLKFMHRKQSRRYDKVNPEERPSLRMNEKSKNIGDSYISKLEKFV